MSDDVMSCRDSLWGQEKLILGPMVRANSAALRLAALQYGADLVYSEEIICARAMNCKRRNNEVIGTTDFIREKSAKDVVFRTHNEIERNQNRCVLQLGASDNVSALRSARIFEKDVAAIDINMGCPKHYAVSVGMGAELMSTIETAEDIIKTLKRNMTIPISVKTRIYDVNNSSNAKKYVEAV